MAELAEKRNWAIDIKNILEAGMRAPSGDNAQPWRFDISGNTIKLFIPSSDNPGSLLDYKNFATYIAHGAVLENMSIAAAYYGYRASITLLPTPRDPLHTATLVLEPYGDERDNAADLFHCITQRSTNRGHYTRGALTPAQRESLVRVPHELHLDARIVVIEDARSIRRIAYDVATQVRILFSHKDLHREFYSVLRFTRDDVLRTRDGLDVETLALSGMQRIMLRYIMHSWHVAQAHSRMGMHRVIAYLEALRYMRTGAFCAVVMKQDTPRDALQAGRILERLWLQATELGLAVQPAFATFLLERGSNDVDFVQYTKGQIAALRASTSRMCGALDVRDDECVMAMVRVGVSHERVTASVRKESDTMINMR